jgi:hypothetical protein
MAIQERPWLLARGCRGGWYWSTPRATGTWPSSWASWLRIFEDLTSQPLTPGEAMALRPSDIDTIIRWTVAHGRTNPGEQADRLVDEMATGVRVLVHYLLTR